VSTSDSSDGEVSLSVGTRTREMEHGVIERRKS
jgi:hypothetical protein